MKGINYSSRLLAAGFVAGLTAMAYAQETAPANDLQYLVPSNPKLFSETAELIPKALIENNFIYLSAKIILGDLQNSNPLNLDRSQIEKLVSEGQDSWSDLEGTEAYRAGFYASTPSFDDKGWFKSEGTYFIDNKDIPAYKDFWLDRFGAERACAILLEKGNVAGFVNMKYTHFPPSKEMLELVKYAESNGFTSIVSEYCPKMDQKSQ